MANDVVVFEGVSRRYRRFGGGPLAVDGLDLRIPAGTSFGLLGRNGAGKTTALRMAMGLMRPTKGCVRVHGRDPFEEPEIVRLDVGYVAEDHEFPGNSTAAEVFALLRDLYPTWDDAFADRLARRFEVPLDRRLSSLSKGEKRLAALIGAVAHRPKLLLLDEPGGCLDPVTRREMLSVIVDLLSAEGATVVFSSHLLDEVERVADRIGILHHGRLLLDETTDRLREGACRVVLRSEALLEPSSFPGCVRLARRDDGWLLTLLCGEGEARKLLGGRDDLEIAKIGSLSLEDLFVDMVGHDRAAPA